MIYLLELLPDDIEVSMEQYKKAVSLNGFSVQIRYPNRIEHMSKEDLEEAINIAQEFRDFAIQKIGIKE
jgi:hypothetical protein